MKCIPFQAAASVTQTLPENAVEVTSLLVVNLTAAPATFTTYTVSSAAAAGTVAQFTGTPAAPSKTVTVATALVATDMVYPIYQEVGSLPSNY